MFGVLAAFEIDAALARLKGLDLVGETGGLFSVPPLPDALERLEKDWEKLLRARSG
jgi:hypothetical protein